MLPDPSLGEAYTSERPQLFGLAYRLTGSVADAEDAVQEAFARALSRPPADATLPWGPWLCRVLVNLCRDRLRARRRTEYVGPWLPEALETDPEGFADAPSGEARYSELESVTVAFLLALEALNPTQRAVLVLRDVLDRSVAEVASLLSLSEGHVKVIHHRARKRMEGYDRTREPPTSAVRDRTLVALQRLMVALAADDAVAMAAALREDVVAINDGGGEFHAARKPVVGRPLVITFHRKVNRGNLAAGFRVALINGLPAVLVRYDTSHDPHLAPRLVFQIECDAAGQITLLRSTVATAKVARVSFEGLMAVGAVQAPT